MPLRVPDMLERMVLVQKGGQPAITSYQVLGAPDLIEAPAKASFSSKPEITKTSSSLICLEPLTLRSYQLRASCFALDAPIIGDQRYASPVITKPMHLHLGYLSFPGRQPNQCYQIRCPPTGWLSANFVQTIRTHISSLPRALRTTNFLAPKKPR